MYAYVNDEKYGEIKYNESFWSGKKELSINGKSFYKVGKNKYSYGSGEDLIEAYLIGNFISGVKVIIGNESIQVIPKSKVYEWILAFIPFRFILTWGYVPVLVSVFLVVGGAIGGAISGGLGALSLMIMKKQSSIGKKLIIGIAMCLATVLACFVLALLMLSTLN